MVNYAGEQSKMIHPIFFPFGLKGEFLIGFNASSPNTLDMWNAGKCSTHQHSSASLIVE